jgi:hypothetical protein
MDAFNDILVKMKTVCTYFEVLNFAVEQMKFTEIREIDCGLEVQMKGSGSFHVTVATAYVQCAVNDEDTHE